jgi:hypothetical protein
MTLTAVGGTLSFVGGTSPQTGDDSGTAVAFVQEVAKGTASGTTTTPTLTIGAGITTTPGNHLLLRLGLNKQPTGITDSQGNTWTLDHVYNRNQWTGFASCKPATPLGAGDTIVITMAASNAIHTAVVEEWSGLDPDTWYGGGDDGWFQAGSGTSRQVSEALTVPAGGVVFGAWTAQTGSETVTPGTGFSLAHSPYVNLNGVSYSLETVQAIDSGSGSSYQPSATGASVHSEGCAAYYV